MTVKLDQLESLWPAYRGAFLLRVAQQSQGQVSNSRVAVTAGHVALSLEVHRATPLPKASTGTRRSPGSSESPTAATLPPAPRTVPSVPQAEPPRLRLTVLLDVVPDDAARPSTQQLARFLRRILEPATQESSAIAGDAGGGSDARKQRGAERGGGDGGIGVGRKHGGGLLGEDVPELLVVENNERVVASEFFDLDNSGSGTQSMGLAYVCIEGNGLLRLWKWEAAGLGWRWTYLNKCNLCASREDPCGSRVLTAVLSPEPERPHRGGSRHRVVWEQEDSGEGAGLGLTLLRAGSSPRRSVWSRRIAFEWDDQDGGGGESGDAGVGGFGTGARLEVALGFSVSLLPTEVDALLCGRRGAWMVAGERVILNHWSTGRMPETVLPQKLLDADEERSGNCDDGFDLEHRYRRNGSDAFTDSESDADEVLLPDEDMDSNHGSSDSQITGKFEFDAREHDISNSTSYRLFAVHDTTSELMIFDPPSAIRTISLPPGGGGLRLSLQCTLDPPPSASPHSLVVRLNQAVFAGGGVCSAYDLCTGRLLGAAPIPRCRACACFHGDIRVRRCVEMQCSCGRRRHQMAQEDHGYGWADRCPMLWVSQTRGHLLGVLSQAQILRARLPRPEACVEALLAPDFGELTSAPRVLQHLREYRRLLGAGKAWPYSLPADLLRLRSVENDTGADRDSGVSVARVRMMDLLGHAFPAEQQCRKPCQNSAFGSIPPWLLLAMMSAAQDNCGQGLASHRFSLAGIKGGYVAGGGDPSTAAAESQLRKSLQEKVAESLRSLDAVRALLRDPAGSSRQGRRAGVVADDGAVNEINAVAAGVDPATALFEGTLRSWLSCRRGEEEGGRKSQRGTFAAGFGATGGSASAGSACTKLGIHHGAEPDDEVALAFRCEAAGDAEAQALPFLRFLLEGLNSDSDPIGGGGEFRDPGRIAKSSSSTFLCLHLSGDDASPLFKVACRAIFRLQPRQLPRFVERLARFRSYADEMKENIDLTASASATVDGGTGGGEGGSSAADERGQPSPPTSPRGADGGDDSNSLKRCRSSGRESESTATSRRDLSPNSNFERKDASSSFRSVSPGRRARRHTWEDTSTHGGLPACDAIDRGSRHGRSSVASSIERSPEPAAVALSGEPKASVEGAIPPSIMNDNSTSPPLVPAAIPSPAARNYFQRALSCLPPAANDGPDGLRRRARLSLLMGARMFTEACRLLRDRAWKGAGDLGGVGWRRDRGAARAWAAAMRLLGELKREASEEAEAASRRLASTSPTNVYHAAATSDGMGSAAVVHGGAGLQYRLAFEDALVETILQDSPDRMEMVMRCRPSGLAPVAVVRMVRRAAANAAAAEVAAGSGASSVDIDSCLGDSGEVNGEPMAALSLRTEDIQLSAGPLSGSTTHTLKRCLLLLVEEDRVKEGAPVS